MSISMIKSISDIPLSFEGYSQTLLIDRAGLHLRKSDDTKLDYAWEDLQGVRIFIEYGRYHDKKQLKLIRMGVSYLDDNTDTIFDEIGLDVNLLKLLIQQGIEKWGQAPPNALAGPPSEPSDFPKTTS
jgi:hypothetical protein